MGEIQIRYDNGVAYERMMGTWSRAAGEIFLDWLTPSRRLRWIDVGCGTGAFTELLVERCAPERIEGVDPSEAQLSFARARRVGQIAKFHRGDALALPFSDATVSCHCTTWTNHPRHFGNPRGWVRNEETRSRALPAAALARSTDHPSLSLDAARHCQAFLVEVENRKGFVFGRPPEDAFASLLSRTRHIEGQVEYIRKEI